MTRRRRRLLTEACDRDGGRLSYSREKWPPAGRACTLGCFTVRQTRSKSGRPPPSSPCCLELCQPRGRTFLAVPLYPLFSSQPQDMSDCQLYCDDSDDVIRIRDVSISPLRSRSSSTSRLVRRRSLCELYEDDSEDGKVIVVIKTKKKRPKTGGLLGWLGCGGDDCSIISVRRVTEPQQPAVRRQPSPSSLTTSILVDGHGFPVQVQICIFCNTYHPSSCFSSFNQGCCMCTGHGHSHSMCHYQRRHRHRRRRHHSRHPDHNPHQACGCGEYEYDSSSEEECNSCSAHHHPRPERVYIDKSIPYGTFPGGATVGEWQMKRRGELYQNSTEHKWRKELIDLMAEQQEEMS